MIEFRPLDHHWYEESNELYINYRTIVKTRYRIFMISTKVFCIKVEQERSLLEAHNYF